MIDYNLTGRKIDLVIFLVAIVTNVIFFYLWSSLMYRMMYYLMSDLSIFHC